MNLLKPSFRNLVFPIILIIMYLIVTNYMYSYSKMGDKYICDIVHLGEKTKEYYEQNNTLELNKSAENLQQLAQAWGDEMPKHAEIFVFMGDFLENINPFFPTPCSMASDKGYCRYYISEETYNCFSSVYEENGLLSAELKPYKKINVFYHIFAMIFLFVEGYIFSVFVLIVFAIFKTKIKKTKKKPNNFGF